MLICPHNYQEIMATSYKCRVEHSKLPVLLKVEHVQVDKKGLKYNMDNNDD